MRIWAIKAGIIALTLTLCLAGNAGAQTTNYLTNGDFSQDLTGWTPVVVEVDPLVFGFGIGVVLGYPPLCHPPQHGNRWLCVSLSIDPEGPPIPRYGDGYAEQQVTLPAGSTVLSLRSWTDYADPATATISLIDAAGIQHVLDAYTPTPITTYSSDVYSCSGKVPETKLYSLAAFAGQTVKLRLEAGFSTLFGHTGFDDAVIAPGDFCRWLGGSGNWSDPAKWLASQPPTGSSWLVLQSGSDVGVDVPDAQIFALTLELGSALTVQPGQGLALNGPAVNNGVITVSGDTTSYSDGNALVQNGSLTIDDGVAMRGLDSGGSDFAFVQTGGTTAVNGTLDWGRGAINVQDGNLNVAPGGTLAAIGIDAGGTGLTQTGGSITVNGTLAMKGMDSGGSDVNLLAGNMTIGSSGVVDAYDIGIAQATGGSAGARPASEREPESTPTGTLTLGGTLAIKTAAGYQPKEGDTFVLMRFGSKTGDFENVTGLDLGGGLQFRKVYTANTLELVVVRSGGGITPVIDLLLLH